MGLQTLTGYKATHHYGSDHQTNPSFSSTLLSDLSLLCQYDRAWVDDDGGIHELEGGWRESVAGIPVAGTDSAREAGRSRQEAQAGTEEVEYEEENGVAPC